MKLNAFASKSDSPPEYIFWLVHNIDSVKVVPERGIPTIKMFLTFSMCLLDVKYSFLKSL